MVNLCHLKTNRSTVFVPKLRKHSHFYPKSALLKVLFLQIVTECSCAWYATTISLYKKNGFCRAVLAARLLFLQQHLNVFLSWAKALQRIRCRTLFCKTSEPSCWLNRDEDVLSCIRKAFGLPICLLPSQPNTFQSLFILSEAHLFCLQSPNNAQKLSWAYSSVYDFYKKKF